MSGELNISQKQAVIKLIEIKGKHKRMIKNWRSVSLHNIDEKPISEVLANRIKKHLPSLISSNKTACVDKNL